MFVVADFLQNVDSPNNRFQDELRLAKMWNVSTRYAVIIGPLCVVVDDFKNFLLQVSIHFLENSDPAAASLLNCRSSLHLFATLENSTRRHSDLNLQL